MRKGQITPELLRTYLQKAWNEKTSVGGYSQDAVSTGQCAPTAMVVQDYFGGELLRVINQGVSHYFNLLPDGTELDLTRDQFPIWAPEPAIVRERSYLEESADTVARYRLLRQRLALIENMK